jgi:cyanophycinase
MTSILMLFILTFSMAYAQTKLLLVGGGNRPAAAMAEFVKAAGAGSSSLLIIPWASEAFEGAENIKKELLASRPGQVEIIVDRTDLKNKLLNATGIFFTGGDQNRLMKEMTDTDTLELLRDLFAKGVVFGGTSAGTAIMSDPMLSGTADLTVIDSTKTELVKGLGLLPAKVIVDQHFILRQRFNRLAGIIYNDQNLTGLAIDENTALFINNKQATVMGPTQVLVFKQLEKNNLSVKMYSEGEKFLLP